ncbi:MAG TPA: glycosyltransferase family 39 protein [Methylomirabilota bacterium]|nr:glycosyltransferase family 39 protein [Methylomirabilota bacterium]
MPSRVRPVRLLLLAVLLLGVGLRLAFLDADPDYYAWSGYITDEGRWVAHARELALFGHIVHADWLLHLILAPLFQATAYVAFALFGVSIWAARLPTALTGCLLLLTFWLLFRRVVEERALLVGLALLALDVDLVQLSRVAVPEMAAMLAQLLAYVLVASGRASPRRMLAAGLVLVGAVAVKATSLPALVICSAIILFQPLPPPEASTRRRGLAMLWAGFLAPMLSVVVVGLVWSPGRLGGLAANLEVLGRFLLPARPFTVVNFFLDAPFAPTLNIWAVGACFSLAVYLLTQGGGDLAVRRHFVASAIWCGLYTPLMLSLDYFPDRYKAHVLVPLAINLTAGLGLMPAARWPASPGRRAAILGLLALPTAALLAPTLAGLAMQAGADPGRVRLRLTCVVLALAVTGWLARRAAGAGEPSRFLWAFPPAGVVGWMLCLRIGLDGGSFWPVAGGGHVAWWSVGAPVTGVLAGLLVVGGRRWTSDRWMALATAAVLAYAAVAVSRIAPSYVTPHYSIRETSRDLGRSLAGTTGLIATSSGEGLFNGNALPYRTVLSKTWPPDDPEVLPEVLVIAFAFHGDEARPAHGYRLTATYRLFVSPEYQDDEPTRHSLGQPEEVRVYRRGGPGEAGR